MDNNNQILEALGKVPGLVEAAEKILEACEEFKKMLAELLNHQIHADIPTEELKKVGATVEQVVKQTRCALPDTAQISGRIAEQASSLFKASINAETKEAVKDALKDTRVTVKHEHSYYPTYEIVKVADKKLVQRFWIMAIVATIAISYSIVGTCIYFNSATFIGREYLEVYRSEYTTDEEREMLAKDVYDTSFLPREYTKAPDLVKAKIKRNKEILRQRKAEAKANKGKFSTKVPLER